MLEWGEKEITVHSLTPDVMGDARILSVVMLGSDETISWNQTADGLVLSIPQTKPCNHAYTYKVCLDKMVGETMESEATNEVLKHGG